jgi:hypothetical protein
VAIEMNCEDAGGLSVIQGRRVAAMLMSWVDRPITETA